MKVVGVTDADPGGPRQVKASVLTGRKRSRASKIAWSRISQEKTEPAK